MRTAIVIFAYNRELVLRRMMNSLLRCEGIDQFDVLVFCDGPKDKDDELKIKCVEKLINEYAQLTIWKSFKVFRHSSNKGLANSVIDGVTTAFNTYDAVICLEDDLLFSRDFVHFIYGALTQYETDMRVWSVTGYSPGIKQLEKYHEETYFAFRGASYGWGTWKNRWELNDWDVSDYDQFKKSKFLRQQFDRGGRDLSLTLDMQMAGGLDSWAIRWCYSQWKNNMLTLYPRDTRVAHIGEGKDATHSKKKTRLQQKMRPYHENLKEFRAELDYMLLKEFYKYYYLNPIKAIAKLTMYRIRGRMK